MKKWKRQTQDEKQKQDGWDKEEIKRGVWGRGLKRRNNKNEGEDLKEAELKMGEKEEKEKEEQGEYEWY